MDQINKVKDWLMGIGIVIFCIGLMIFPANRQVISPKSWTTFFTTAAESGYFINLGFVIVWIGIVLIITSLFIKRQ